MSSNMGLDTSRDEYNAQHSNLHPSPTVAGPTTNVGSTNLSGLVCNVYKTTGREPHALVGATTTILGDKLYVFGGRMLSRTRPDLTSDLYELDLIRRHWSKLQTTGHVPSPRYFHSVCALGDTKLVCYGGMSPRTTQTSQSSSLSPSGNQESQPEIVVMSDVHILDVPTRTWTRIHTDNTPQGRYAHCAAILPSSAIFTSAQAPLSAIQNNPSSANPHQGTIGVDIDGFGGAEMVVVGGQDSSNHYIEQISVFNLRSLKWTVTTPLDRSCGAYRSVVAPLINTPASQIGESHKESDPTNTESENQGTPLLIYSNYHFLNVKLELQVRLPDGNLIEKTMDTSISPPGLRFPNGGIINGHFVVSGTYLTSSKQEYALWALNLKTLTWGRIDVGGTIFSNGSWNRGVLWNRRSTFVILGHRKRSLVEDYNHRRLNFAHVCMVELEAFGLYENPRRTSPTSGYQSVSAPAIPASIQPKFSQQAGGGRQYSSAAQQLGLMAQSFVELSDMELLTIGGERIPVNSHIIARRWGPYFVRLLRESTAVASDSLSDVATVRQPGSSFGNNHSSNKRNSNITITPSISNTSQYSTATTLVNQPSTIANTGRKDSAAALPNLEIPSAHSLTPTSRPRTLYLPHTHLTVQLLVHFLYTSSLPPIDSPLCTPQILCSLLQLARPYQVDGLLEATVERLHQVLDGRNAAAVFNAAAMAAGGGRGTGFTSGPGGTLEVLNGVKLRSDQPGTSPNSQMSAIHSSSDNDGGHADRKSASGRRESSNSASQQRPSNLRINTDLGMRHRAESISSASTVTSASTNTSFSYTDSDMGRQSSSGDGSSRHHAHSRPDRDVWTGGISCVVGLQKRGLRGLMEGRRLRERGAINGGDDRSTPTAGITSNTTYMTSAAPGSAMGI
uniref:Ral2 protein n=1 Tax=Coccidioides posadasii RMSCC 3488 TaxID=454284 RepID=A0A0J6FDW1_COCPO|nr:ral2 protein [Coccidioides posadasii RMSCC 3488]